MILLLGSAGSRLLVSTLVLLRRGRYDHFSELLSLTLSNTVLTVTRNYLVTSDKIRLEGNWDIWDELGASKGVNRRQLGPVPLVLITLQHRHYIQK